VYYRHRLAVDNISEKMRIQSTCSIAQLKHSMSSFKQYVPNSKYALTVYYRHRLAGNSISGNMGIQSTCSITQLKHSTSSFKQYLLEERVHINNAQLGPEEAVVLGWIQGPHPAFSFRDSMRESIKELMKLKYSTIE
jgi:predicted oxidoreductase